MTEITKLLWLTSLWAHICQIHTTANLTKEHTLTNLKINLNKETHKQQLTQTEVLKCIMLIIVYKNMYTVKFISLSERFYELSCPSVI